MFQQIEISVSVIFALLAMIFLVIGVYVGYKNYGKLLPIKKTGVRYFILAALCMGFALFMFLIAEVGYSWEILVLSICSILALSIFLTSADLIKKITSRLLVTKDSLSPLEQFIKLFNLIKNKPSDEQESGVDGRHEN